MKPYAKLGPLNLDQAKLLHFPRDDDFLVGTKLFLEDIGVDSLYHASGNPRTTSTSYHAGGQLLTIHYRPRKMVLCQTNEPIEGHYLTKVTNIELFRKGLIDLAQKRKVLLLKEHSEFSLDDINKLPTVVSSVEVSIMNTNEIIDFVERFYSDAFKSHFYHRYMTLKYLGIPCDEMLSKLKPEMIREIEESCNLDSLQKQKLLRKISLKKPEDLFKI